VDEDRNTSLLMWKRLRNPVNEVLKIEQEFIKSYEHHHLDIQCYEAKDLHQKKSFNIEDKNTIIKIKSIGLGSLTANWNECKNDTNPAGST
jgi:hypothetical protein